jgi:DNA-binding SARP family transcriptional activator
MGAVGEPGREISSVRVLGGVYAVAVDGALIDLPSASQRRLVAILAVHSPRRLRSEWLADALAMSPGALRTLVSRVRTTVGPAMLETTSTGYALVGDVDAARFCQAVADAADAPDRVRAVERALAWWSGPALEEFAGEEWADGEIARLTEIHAGTVDDLADALLGQRRAADAVALLEAQIARYPYRDRPRGLLIRALASAGRQADALRAFQEYRSLLIDEFGTDPSPDVVRIERRVATGWDGTEPGTISRAATPNRNSGKIDFPLPGPLSRAVPLVGRAGALEACAAELARITDSGSRCVIISGESGIGKTALLAAFAQSIVAAGSATVVYGRCDETPVSWQPFRSVFATCVEHAPGAILTEHVANAGGELVRISPSLAVRVATAPAPTRSDDATERFLAFEAAADLVRRISAARPLVLMLDDLQWAEPTALLLLRHLARSLAASPVLLVLSTRDAGDHAPEVLRATLADLDQHPTRRLELHGLAADELRDLVRAAEPGAGENLPVPVLEALRVQTAGNPLFASQLIRHWEEEGFDPVAAPQSLRDVVWSRVAALGEAATDVLTAAAVLGIEFDEDVLIEMVGRPDTTVIDTLDVAARNGLLVDAGSVRRSLRFVHVLVANALLADVGPARRARLHGLAARALEKHFEDLPPQLVVQLARHCALAGWPAEARQWSIRAGDHALDHLAPAEAADHYRVALDITIALDRPESERADLLVRLGDAQHRAGDTDAFETLVQGARLARHSGADGALVRAALAADRGFMRLDERAEEYLAIVEAALAVTDPADIPTFARLRALLARSLNFSPDAARRLAAAHEALDLATQHGDPKLFAQVAPAALYALWAPGQSALRTRVAARAVVAAERTSDPLLEFGADLSAYNTAVESADHAVAARSLAKLRATVRDVAEPRLRWTLGIVETFEATMAGRLEEAETLATDNLDLGMQIGALDAFSIFAGQVFVIGTFGGRHEELFPLVEQAAKDNVAVLAFKLAHGIISAAVGRDDIARELLREGTSTRFSELALDNVFMTSLIGYAVLAIELEDAQAAAHLLPLVEPFATEVSFNGLTSQGPVAAYAGKLASLLERYEAAEQYLRAALETATAFGWTYHRATTLFALAQNRHRELAGLDAESEAWLAEASALCRAGGFRSWVPQIDALAGAR